jgi:3-deoxy-manno-octulosonate cytidylyltransferase (CMP-KDO synthetase)
MKAVGIIPARYHSSRLPGKPLADIAGKPMLQWVYERACRAVRLTGVLVATDDARIFDAVQAFGGAVVMTSPEHLTGTDRLAEAAAELDADVIVNVQGDEPLLDPAVIDAVAAPFETEPELAMATLATPIRNPQDALATSVVKVVMDRQGNALYFSRLPIPHYRGGSDGTHWKHIGLYAYGRDFLLRYPRLEPTPLERAEALEQLRALEHGYRIRVLLTDHDAISVDTPEDLERVRALVEVESSK